MAEPRGNELDNAVSAPSRAGSLHLIAGALALDFANTSSGRGTAHLQEHLRSYGDLLAWSAHAAALPASACDRLRRTASKSPTAAQAVLDRAVALREALRQVVLSFAAGDPPDAAHVATVRSEAAAAISAAELDLSAARDRWRWPDETSDLARPLWPVARSAMAVLEEADPRRLKLCPARDCGWIFLDRSKNNSRRWCDMAVCGNRAKARRFYRRAGR